MALIALMIGSLVGTVGGVFGWLAFDMTGVEALTLYVCASLMFPVMVFAVTAVVKIGRPKTTPAVDESCGYTA